MKERAVADRVEEIVESVRRRWGQAPRAGLILGTGLGPLAGEIEGGATIPYAQLPHFPRSTAPGHAGRLVCGWLEGCPLVAMDGRFHRYEGYSSDQLALPVRVLRALGAELLWVSNASGGLNSHFAAGDVMVLVDHIDLMWDATAERAAAQSAGFPVRPPRPAAPPYDPEMIRLAGEMARRADFPLHQGVYVAVTGPNYETRAEYRFFRRIGGDAVGMSTVPEVKTALACGMRVLALSAVANVATPDALRPITADQVIAAANRAAGNLGKILRGVAAHFANSPPRQPVLDSSPKEA